MKPIQHILMIQFAAAIGVSLLLVILFETGILPIGSLSQWLNAEFLCRCFMEVATLGGIWLALRLFKMAKVHTDLLRRKEQALRCWGTVRLAILGGLMVVNTLLYYIYMQTTYGYMAIILLLCMPFVYPSMGRCLADVEE